MQNNAFYRLFLNRNNKTSTMINDQKNFNKKPAQRPENSGSEDNLSPNETETTGNAFLGQQGREQEGKTESFQGNWSGNYGSGFINTGNDESTGDFVSQASNTGNGLTSDEDDLLASGQNVDDTGLDIGGRGTTKGKQGEDMQAKKERNEGAGAGYGDTDASAQGAVNPETNDENRDPIMEDEGPDLVTSGDVASMTGQNIDDLNLPSADDVAGWRQDAGTIGQDAEDKEVVDDGRRNTLDQNSGEAVTGKADMEGGFSQYPESGDLGQVDPGQQNYKEDQDKRQAFTAGDYKTSQEKDPEEGSDKYNPQKTNSADEGDPNRNDTV